MQKLEKQMQFSVNSIGTMEAEIIQKNAASQKSQMSKENILKKLIIFCVLICFSYTTWGQEVTSLKSIKQAAEKGDAMAQYVLGNIYYWSSDFYFKDSGYELDTKIEINQEQAVYWYQKAAKQGKAVAQLSLGDCYDEDEDTALFWYEKSLKNEDNSLSEKN